ncbi:type I methionyl aminopeptidase [Patescibacteria group bacterium]
MSKIKSEKDIEILRKAGKLLAQVLQELKERVKPGIKTEELDRYAHDRIRELGGEPAFLNYRGFPGSICISLNNEIVHGIPGPRVLEDGDIISLDFGVEYKELFVDAAITVPVGEIDPKIAHLMEITKDSLKKGIQQVRDGKTVGDIGAAVEECAKPHRYGVVRVLTGHGVGHAIHEPPIIPNFGTPGEGEKLEAGMVIAIEPMFTLGTHEVELQPDKWTYATADGSIAAHYEHTVLVKKGGSEILTIL